MISAESFVQKAATAGFKLYSGVPCSYLKPFVNFATGSDLIRYVPATNEGDAIAIAAGAELGGCRAVAMMQNSGLGNAVNPLTSLTYTFNIPILLIVTLRGEPGGPADEPQHELMGRITTSMLESMEIPWCYFPSEENEITVALKKATAHMDATGRPFAFVMRKGAVEAWPHNAELAAHPRPAAACTEAENASATRMEMLTCIQNTSKPSDVLLATTGFTGRELYTLSDEENQLYMVGSMGCISSLGLGLALVQPQRRVIAIDGDGALLMRMGVLATTAYQEPDNLIHILLDNGVHESTGAQPTVSKSVDFTAIAAACGYKQVYRVNSAESLDALLNSALEGPVFIHVPTLPGVPDGLARPSITPADVAVRLRKWMSKTQ